MTQLTYTGTGSVRRFDFFSLRDFSASPEEAGNAPMTAAAEPQVEAPPPPPPPPTFSQQELEAVQAKARDEGYASGMQEGMLKAKKADGEREQHLIGIVRQCCEKINAFRAEYAQHVAHQQEELTRLAIAVARHVAGEALREAPEVPVAHMVSECLPLLLGEPRISITVHPSIIPLLKERLEEVGRQSGYDGTLMLEVDAAIAPSDCHIQWQGGSARSSLEETWRAVEEKLAHIPIQS